MNIIHLVNVMRRPLALSQINAFDAAARHLSFSRAARELNVQQPAVSRQIAALESELGTALFLRTKPRLTLTTEGRILAEAVSAGLEAISDGMRQIKARRADEPVVVNASIGFTSLYLLPRLAEFQSAHPDINLQIVTRDQNDDFDLQQADVVIHFGEQAGIGAENGLIFKEQMVAVCAPEVLADGSPLTRTALADERLLYLSSEAHADDWRRFFDGTDEELHLPETRDVYHSYMVYLRAIQNGLGFGIGWLPMLDETLASGSLVLACKDVVTTDRAYHCAITASGAKKSGAIKFMHWLTAD